MKDLRTQRLHLRRLQAADADFTLQLLNDPGWLRFIGDRGLRTRADAEAFLREGHWTRYEEWGFGFLGLERHDTPGLIGVCGLARRPYLDTPDLGFALLEGFRGRGYAPEAALAVLDFAAQLGLPRVLATVRPENLASRQVLQRLGMVEEGEFLLPDSGRRLLRYAVVPARRP